MKSIGGKIETVEIAGVCFDVKSSKQTILERITVAFRRFVSKIRIIFRKILDWYYRQAIKRAVKKQFSLKDFVEMDISVDSNDGTIYYSGKEKHLNMITELFPHQPGKES